MNNLRDEKILITLGKHIRMLRQGKKMTMMELAFAADIEYKQLSRVEKGQTNVTITTLVAIAKGLEVTVEEIAKVLSYNFS